VDSLVGFLRFAPLISAAAWFSLAALQVLRDRWHTWTETFFLFACFFAGLYAIGDWLFFNVNPSNPSQALLAARISITSLTLSTNFFLLFTLVYVDRMRRSYWLANVVSLGILFMVWGGTVMLEGVVFPPSSVVFVPIFNPFAFGVFLVYILIYFAIGDYNLFRLNRIVRETSRSLARRTLGLLVVFTVVPILGLGTNGLIGIARLSIPPPFSTLLIFVAGAVYYVLYPIGRERISEAIRRFQARRYSIKAVFVTFEDGTLIGAKTRPGETPIDQDLFGATLDVIQNFMRTSFPILRGKWLSSISQGPYILVMERARYTSLTIVLEGQESDQLRRQMRDLLLSFENRNREVLTRWQGIPNQAEGTDEMLSQFFVEELLT
jgi:predicted membrane protein